MRAASHPLRIIIEEEVTSRISLAETKLPSLRHQVEMKPDTAEPFVR
jgi:hypothetical protein